MSKPKKQRWRRSKNGCQHSYRIKSGWRAHTGDQRYVCGDCGSAPDVFYDKTGKLVTDPTPDEIRKTTAMIRAGWSHQETMRRMYGSSTTQRERRLERDSERIMPITILTGDLNSIQRTWLQNLLDEERPSA